MISVKMNLQQKNQHRDSLWYKRKFPGKEHKGFFQDDKNIIFLKWVKDCMGVFVKNVRLRFVPFSVCTSYITSKTKKVKGVEKALKYRRKKNGTGLVAVEAE